MATELESPDYLRELSVAELREVDLRLSRVYDARDSLLQYGYVMYGDRFRTSRHHRLIAKYLERLERGEIDRLVLSMPPRHGKPVSVSSPVMTADGTTVPIGSVKVGDRVITHLGRPRAVLAVHEQGLLPVRKVRTFSGREMVLALDHPVMTTDGWVEAGNLTLKHVLAVPNGITTNPTVAMPAHEARLLGYFIGDGSCTGTNASIAKNDPDMQREIVACAEAMGFSAVVRDKGVGNYAVCVAGGVREWLRSHGVAGKKSIEKRVPAAVHRASNEAVAEFLAAYYDCDGSITTKGKARGDCCIELYSSSPGMLEECRTLLARLGIMAKVSSKVAKYKMKDGTYRHFDAWRMGLQSRDAVARFAKRIPLRSHKRDVLDAWSPARTLFDSPWMSDPVVALDDGGTRVCRCLTVAEDSTFLVSELVVHNSLLTSAIFPAWYLGRNPADEFMFVTYAQELSNRFGRQVRHYISLDAHSSIFPKSKIVRGSATQYSLTTTEWGAYSAMGVGGPLTGKGANCVAAGTLVECRVHGTDRVSIPIEDIPSRERLLRVLAVDRDSGAVAWRRVEAFREITADALIKIETSAGRELSLTPEHRVWVVGRGYVEARDLRHDDPLLAVRDRPGRGVRRPSAPSAPTDGVPWSPLWEIPTGMPWVDEDRVLRVTLLGGGAHRVYDIQVEGAHNFFAGALNISNCLLIDDPVKNREEASSDLVMTALHEWYTSAAYSRLQGAGKICIIQTRWSEKDLIGWVLAEQADDGWAILSLPAIAEQDEWIQDDIGPDRLPDGTLEDLPSRRVGNRVEWLFRRRGEALWPTQYPIEALRRIERAMPRRDWMSLYQQRVAEEDGTLFKKDWVQLLDRPNSGIGLNVYLLVDPANAKGKRSDSTAMWVVGLGPDQNYYVLDGIRDKLNLTEKADALFALHRRWHPLRVGYEEYAIQADIQYMKDRQQRDNYRFEILPLRGLTKKQHRIEALEPMFRARRVFFPKTMPYTQVDGKAVDLVREFMAEYIAFPAGAHDDMLDSLSRIVDPHFPTSWPMTNEEKGLLETEAEDEEPGHTWMSA